LKKCKKIKNCKNLAQGQDGGGMKWVAICDIDWFIGGFIHSLGTDTTKSVGL